MIKIILQTEMIPSSDWSGQTVQIQIKTSLTVIPGCALCDIPVVATLLVPYDLECQDIMRGLWCLNTHDLYDNVRSFFSLA